ncbi:MAG: hypothetical protein AB7T31_16890 [Gemmatimonadales bacterium]
MRRAAALAALTIVGACGILDVDEGGVIDFEDLDEAGPSAVGALVNGIVGAYQEALDDVVRYSSLLTDEMIMSGTFETRVDVDRRRIQPGNATLTSSIYTQIHVARMQADTAVALLEEKLPDPAFASVEADMREGIALGKLYGGLSRLWLGEMYCWSILTGMYPEASPVLPNARIADARAFLVDAEGRAGPLGLENVRLAAVVGQARAQLWLGNYTQADALALAVPRDFTYWAEYSYNEPEQFNEVYQFTWGDIEGIHWTVGDGTTPERGNERFAYFDEFVRLNLIDVEPDGFEAVSSSTPVMLQKIYRRPDSRILVASGVEAQLIRAEVAVRSGQTLVAEQLLNDLRADYSFRATVNWGVEPPAPVDALLPLVLTDTLATDLRTVAGERARELWLTGDRLTTSRRLRRDTSISIDLFPPVKAGVGGGDDITFPIVQLELDANPNLSAANACPAGQSIGTWR